MIEFKYRVSYLFSPFCNSRLSLPQYSTLVNVDREAISHQISETNKNYISDSVIGQCTMIIFICKSELHGPSEANFIKISGLIKYKLKSYKYDQSDQQAFLLIGITTKTTSMLTLM